MYYFYRYGNIRETYKDDWDSEDEDLLAEVLSDLNFFSAEKRTTAFSEGEVTCVAYTYIYLQFSILLSALCFLSSFQVAAT